MTFWPQGAGPIKYAVARPIHMSNSHTKFGWISSKALGGDSVTNGRTDGGDCHIPYAFFKKKNMGIKRSQYLVADEKDGFQLLLTSPLLNKVNVGVRDRTDRKY